MGWMPQPKDKNCWTIKKAERWIIDAFDLWWWRWLLRVPWTMRRSNKSILREINPEDLLEGLMLKLKLHYFGHMMQTDSSLEESLMLGKIEGRRRGVSEDKVAGQYHWWRIMNLGKLWEMVRESGAWHAAVHGVTKSQTQLGNWTTTKMQVSSKKASK